MEQIVKIISIKPVTHNVRQYRVEKPEGYRFVPGQATEVSINKREWENERRPFTFTALNEDPFLEFTIKSYSDHDGVTNALGQLKANDELIIRDVWGAISYQGEGYFIAGGAGITPFLAILRQLNKQKQLGNNKLFFSNKTADDIILKDELQGMLGTNALFVVTDRRSDEYLSGRIDEGFLKEHVSDFSKKFYVCGPDKMIADINQVLLRLGAQPDLVVFEK